MAIHLDRQRPPKKKMGRNQRRGSKSNPGTGVQWANWLDNPAGAPGGGGVPATGAIAGTPGTFTPEGSTPPFDLAAMAPIVASPIAAWTTGQFVMMGNNNSCHWNGTNWAGGGAAVEDPEVQSTTPTMSWTKADIIEWIEKNVETEGDLEACTKAELLELTEG